MASVLGRFTPHKSFFHRLDARLKLFGLIGFMVLVFFSTGNFAIDFLYYFVLAIIVLIMLKVSKVSFKQIFKQLKALWFMLLFMLIINVLTYQTDHQSILFMIGTFPVYDTAIYQTLYIFLRLVIMLSLTLVLTATTKPLELTYALSWYMHPLSVIKFPVHEVSMTISIALRFIPTLLDETGRIMKAQESRGVDFKKGKMSEKIRGIVSLIVPLFISAFQRSEELANAMEARGYDPNGKRTSYRKLKFTYRDLIAFVFVIILVAGGICFLVFDKQIISSLTPYINQLFAYISSGLIKIFNWLKGLF